MDRRKMFNILNFVHGYELDGLPSIPDLDGIQNEAGHRDSKKSHDVVAVKVNSNEPE